MSLSEPAYLQNEVLINDTLHFLGVRVDNISKETALKFICNSIRNKKEMKPRKIFFTNVHTIHLARKNKKFKDTVNNADLCLPDGSGLKIAGKVFSRAIKENLNGTDFTPVILSLAEKEGWSIYMLGARPEIVVKCAIKVQEEYPHLKITGLHSGYFTPDELPSIVKDINNTSPDILLVAMGSPDQELFIEYVASRVNHVVCFAVGGLFDFLSGDKKRAPKILRRLGIEWLFRFLQDPKTKWNRIFIEIPHFLFLILAARFIPNAGFNSTNRKLGYR